MNTTFLTSQTHHCYTACVITINALDWPTEQSYYKNVLGMSTTFLTSQAHHCYTPCVITMNALGWPAQGVYCNNGCCVTVVCLWRQKSCAHPKDIFNGVSPRGTCDLWQTPAACFQVCFVNCQKSLYQVYKKGDRNMKRLEYYKYIDYWKPATKMDTRSGFCVRHPRLLKTSL